VVLTLHDFFPVCYRFFRVKPGEREVCEPSMSPSECFSCARQEYRPWPRELVDALYARRSSMGEEIKSASYLYTFSKTVAAFYRRIPFLPSLDIDVLPMGSTWIPFLPSLDIDVLPMGLLRPLFLSEPREACRPLMIAAWGGHNEVKGTHLLLEAAAREELKNKVEVHILGRIVDPDYKKRLQDLAQGCAAVFHGYFPEAEKDSLGRRYDLAVFPTQAFETYSIVVDEALSMGMPVIATSPGAQSERLEGGGIVVPSGDVDALAEGILSFLDDRFRILKAQKAAAARVGTMDRHWLKLSRVYEDLVFKSPRQGRRSFVTASYLQRGGAGGSGRGRPPYSPP
jgi:glycosyltransferase involved in cell wall biosynthesis